MNLRILFSVSSILTTVFVRVSVAAPITDEAYKADLGANIQEYSEGEIRQGRYLVRLGGCADCHTTRTDRPFAGGQRMDTPVGVYYSANITPDPNTGLGHWTFYDFRRALRYGISPQHYAYYPAFPYRSYTKITDQDLRKMWAYLKSLKPESNAVPPNEPAFGINRVSVLGWWSTYFVAPKLYGWLPEETRMQTSYGPFKPVRNQSKGWNRGAYLAEGLFHCTECHTSRLAVTGGLKIDYWMAGGNWKVGDLYAPNITPDPETGRPWTREQWRKFLRVGRTPQNTYPRAEMSLVIQNTAAMTDEDADALIEYLMALKPIYYRAADVR